MKLLFQALPFTGGIEIAMVVVLLCMYLTPLCAPLSTRVPFHLAYNVSGSRSLPVAFLLVLSLAVFIAHLSLVPSLLMMCLSVLKACYRVRDLLLLVVISM
jgi:hypothetical protein